MSIPVAQCVALTKLTPKVKIYAVDENEISISDDGISHIFMHGPKEYDIQHLKTKIRIVLKEMIKKDTYDVEGKEYTDDYSFDLTIDFLRGSQDWKEFTGRLDAIGYNS